MTKQERLDAIARVMEVLEDLWSDWDIPEPPEGAVAPDLPEGQEPTEAQADLELGILLQDCEADMDELKEYVEADDDAPTGQ